jgi:hypothetical protein
MKQSTLTRRQGLATNPAMNHRTKALKADRIAKMAMAATLASVLSGCITLKAPDKPIVIELNINIKQEVIYRLAADAGKTIDSNKEIF